LKKKIEKKVIEKKHSETINKAVTPNNKEIKLQSQKKNHKKAEEQQQQVLIQSSLDDDKYLSTDDLPTVSTQELESVSDDSEGLVSSVINSVYSAFQPKTWEDDQDSFN